MTINTIHSELLQSVLGRRALTEDDALLWMVLFHTHEIHLQSGVLSRGGRPVPRLAPLTQRSAASVIAKVWRNRKDPERTTYVYWYWEFNRRGPYEVLSNVPEELLPRLEELRNTLTREPRVVAVIEEE
jgi:hypothetical protein